MFHLVIIIKGPFPLKELKNYFDLAGLFIGGCDF